MYQIVYFQLQTLSQKLAVEGSGIQVQISGFWPRAPDPLFQIQTLSQKLNCEGKGIHLQISAFWPGVPDRLFPNTNF